MEDKEVQLTNNENPEEMKKLFTKDNPHPTGAYWDPETNKWKGYRPKAGYSPPWMPFRQGPRKRKVTINEKKFLMVLSQTGSMNEAFRAAYKVTPYPDKRIEKARITAMATQILRRLKDKAPELVSAFTFDDINPDFIKHEMLKLYKSDHATISEQTRLLELMGKTQAMFTDKVMSDTRIREVVDPIYQETDEDFPENKIDERKTRLEIEENNS